MKRLIFNIGHWGQKNKTAHHCDVLSCREEASRKLPSAIIVRAWRDKNAGVGVPLLKGQPEGCPFVEKRYELSNKYIKDYQAIVKFIDDNFTSLNGLG